MPVLPLVVMNMASPLPRLKPESSFTLAAFEQTSQCVQVLTSTAETVHQCDEDILEIAMTNC